MFIVVSKSTYVDQGGTESDAPETGGSTGTTAPVSD